MNLFIIIYDLRNIPQTQEKMNKLRFLALLKMKIHEMEMKKEELLYENCWFKLILKYVCLDEWMLGTYMKASITVKLWLINLFIAYSVIGIFLYQFDLFVIVFIVRWF